MTAGDPLLRMNLLMLGFPVLDSGRTLEPVSLDWQGVGSDLSTYDGEASAESTRYPQLQEITG